MILQWGSGAVPPNADKNSVFNVLKIVSNCRNFFNLVTSDTFPHNYFDTDEPTVPLRYIQCILQVNKVKIIVNIRLWMGKYFLHTMRATIILKYSVIFKDIKYCYLILIIQAYSLY